MTTPFKLIQREGFTRRLTFPNKPTWHTLAAKIESLYAIPLDKVSVAYVDADDDEVTLSTQEELDDFYQSSHQPGQTIKFIIQDLSSTRVQSNAQFTNPVSNLNIRDTFGGEGFDIDDDWQPLPPFTGVGGMFAPRASGAESPHAFVEVVGSDADLISTQHETNIDNETDTVQSVTGDRTSPLNKGKERAVADDSSTCSVLAEYTPAKPPVHVYDRNSCDKDAISASSGHGPASTLGTPHSPPVPIHAESVPKVATQTSADRENNTSQDAQTAPNSPNEAADPPLPSLESATAPSTSPSLCNDVAALLTSFMSTVNEHPELAEGVHNIIRNTAGGTYWNTHRQAMSHATAELIQTNDEIRRRAEEEAGRNVADALGTMFQALSQTLGPINAGSSQATPASPEGGSARHPEQPATANSTSFWYGTPEANIRPSLNRPSGPAHHPPHGPFPNPWMRRGPFGPAHGAWGSWYTPTPPMPPPRGTTGHRHGPPPPPPPGPPGHQQGPLPPLPPLAAPFLGSWEPEAPIPLGPTPVTNTSRVNPTPDESKAKVDAARLRYKAEKGRYRQEREERKKERERKAHTTGGNINQNVEMRTVPRPQDNLTAGPSNTQPAAIVSNGRGDYPTIELVSVHRNHTHPGHGSSARRNLFEHGDVKSRTLNRISRRLADMGFTDNAYPDLLGKIKEQMPSSGVMSKEAEDDIVTTLLEELLAAPPRPPVPSGSNAKDTNIPGAWH